MVGLPVIFGFFSSFAGLSAIQLPLPHTWIAEPPASSQDEAGSVPVPGPIRITAREAGILQTFPAGYPWAGNKGQQSMKN